MTCLKEITRDTTMVLEEARDVNEGCVTAKIQYSGKY